MLRRAGLLTAALLSLTSRITFATDALQGPVALYPNQYDAAVLADSPVGYWKLNETSGTTAFNSGTGGAIINGTYVGIGTALTLGQPGPFGAGSYAALFSGTATPNTPGYVNVSDTGANPLDVSNLTVEGWVNWTSGSPLGGIIVNKENSYEVAMNGANNIQAALWANAAWNWAGSGPTSYDAWHHVAVTWDGTTQRIYIDGVNTSTTSPIPGGTGPLANNDQDFRIGTRNGDAAPTGSYWNGLLSDIAIYGTALTQAQIQAHIAAASQEPPPPPLTPEPASVALFGLTALIGGAFYWNRRRKLRSHA